jgi:hypothetical protein
MVRSLTEQRLHSIDTVVLRWLDAFIALQTPNPALSAEKQLHCIISVTTPCVLVTQSCASITFECQCVQLRSALADSTCALCALQDSALRLRYVFNLNLGKAQHSLALLQCCCTYRLV